jgi:peptide/nickel transport system permease protein
VQLAWFPTLASTNDPSGLIDQLWRLTLPVFALVIVYFGYIARMARAGVITAMEADYTRTAFMKGLPRGVVIRRHVLRNALLPTISVVATQTGYLFGGLLAVELIFNYNGLGRELVRAAVSKDLPVLSAGVLLIGVVYMIATLLGDILISILNPRVRLGDQSWASSKTRSRRSRRCPARTSSHRRRRRRRATRRCGCSSAARRRSSA